VPQPRHDQLPHGAVIAVELDPFVDVRDLAALALGLGDLTTLPAVRGETAHTRQHARAAAANRDEADLALGQLAQPGIGGRANRRASGPGIAPSALSSTRRTSGPWHRPRHEGHWSSRNRAPAGRPLAPRRPSPWGGPGSASGPSGSPDRARRRGREWRGSRG